FRAAIRFIKEAEVPVVGFAIGRRASQFLRKSVPEVIAIREDIPDGVELSDVSGVINSAMNHFLNGDLDEVWLLYSEFVNTMTQRPKLVRVLPCPEVAEPTHPGYWDYLYEPDAPTVLDALLRRYVEAVVYHGVIENKASEHSARMIAMKSATDNANNLVRELRITYNKARQAAITKEIAEITAGAEAAK
ncbi:MAG: F0F1 ATP synthase subunit gamma, partial [Zetaproteobacteria bacterium]